MSEAGLPREVARFIDEHVTSVGQLEVLLLLGRRREVELTAADVARELRIDDGFAASELRQLVAHGLLAERPGTPPAFRYAPGRLAAVVDAVAEAYAQRRVSVIDRIFAKPSGTILAFADAFRLRKE